MQHDPNEPRATLASTLDPNDVRFQGWYPPLPWIFVNDGGFDLEYGFWPGFDPPAVVGWNVTEHETEHYLARFRDRTFYVPPPPRTYDRGEHAPEMSWNLLRPYVGPGQPFPLAVPGRWDQPNCEKYQIYFRIVTGQWNDP